jgi:SAM-dependent methyltransferase
MPNTARASTDAPATTPGACVVCGATELRCVDVLPPELIEAWQLSPEESAYVNRQQGRHCAHCGSTLRCMALATAIMRLYRWEGRFADFVASPGAARLDVLEVNEAGGLTAFLARMPRRQLASFPAVDMRALPFADGSFDLVVHSDTLEHVPSPGGGLAECRRVLRDGGACAFTVPLVLDRLTRSRDGLPPSFHGAPGAPDRYLVHTEFGSDAWRYVFAAGFAECRLVALEPPAAFAITAIRGPSAR